MAAHKTIKNLNRDALISALPTDALDASAWWTSAKWTQPKIKQYIGVSAKNEKMGHVLSFSKLAGANAVTTASGYTRTYMGTCGGCCSACEGDCYAIASEKYHCNTSPLAWGRNTILSRENPDLYYFLIDAFIASKKKCNVVRIHVSGEFETLHELREWNGMAFRHPEIVFYTYTKRYMFLKLLTNKAPNFVINISEWKNHAEIEAIKKLLPFKVGTFVYVPQSEKDNPIYKGLSMCPTVDFSGKHTGVTCEKCPLCKMNIRKGVWAH